MSGKPFQYSDNVRVNRGKTHAGEFLQISASEPNDWKPSQVSLTRYTVPGRFDTYDFDYVQSPQQGVGDRLRYFTDTETPIGEAVQIAKRDLNKKYVVEMILKALDEIPYPYAHDLNSIVKSIAPNSKTSKALDQWYIKRRKQIKANIAERKAKRSPETANPYPFLE